MFRVGITRDFLGRDGSIGFGDIGLDALESAGIAWAVLPGTEPEIPSEQAREFDGLLVLAPKVTALTVEDPSRLKIVARFGVGYDNIDVAASIIPCSLKPHAGSWPRAERRGRSRRSR